MCVDSKSAKQTVRHAVVHAGNALHPYSHTDIHIYMQPYRQTSIHTYSQQHNQSGTHTYMYAVRQAYTTSPAHIVRSGQASIQTYSNTCSHASIQPGIWPDRHIAWITIIQTCKRPPSRTCIATHQDGHANRPVGRPTSMPANQLTDTSTARHACIQAITLSYGQRQTDIHTYITHQTDTLVHSQRDMHTYASIPAHQPADTPPPIQTVRPTANHPSSQAYNSC